MSTSMSISSLTSTSSTSTINSSTSTRKAKSSSVKSSAEYRALRQQFFHLQSTHSNLKLVHERESILATTQKSQLQEKLQSLQLQLDEIRKDQVFLLNSEREIKDELERVLNEKDHLENSFKDRIAELESKLLKEQEKSFDLQSQLSKSSEKKGPQDFAVNNFDELLLEWKERVISLTNQNQMLESQVDELKSKIAHLESFSPQSSTIINDSNEELRRKLLSTYVSLESAQSVLAQKKAEAERLAARIGNVKILEEKYRDAQIKIKRLETALAGSSDQINRTSASSSTTSRPESPTDALSGNLKLIELTKEIGSLKESLALTSLNYTTLQSELTAKQAEFDSLKTELEATKVTVSKLQTSNKVKDSTIANLKEQLDSTVNLLTETLKKK